MVRELLQELGVLPDQHPELLSRERAPERGQPFGTKAGGNLAGKVFGQIVRVEVIDVDRYHRRRIFLGNRFINAEMARDGSRGVM